MGVNHSQQIGLNFPDLIGVRQNAASESSGDWKLFSRWVQFVETILCIAFKSFQSYRSCRKYYQRSIDKKSSTERD